MKIQINVPELFKVAFFYFDWANKSKNLKTKRKLLIKVEKEINKVRVNKLNQKYYNGIIKNSIWW